MEACMGRYFTEKARRLPICTKYDIAVVGGGIAGVSAALSAARRGKKVLLLERMFALGGLATLGLITVYLPLCDGNGKQVSFGIAEELLKLSIRYGFEADNPDTWLKPGKGEHGKQRYQVRFNAQVFSVLMEDLSSRTRAAGSLWRRLPLWMPAEMRMSLSLPARRPLFMKRKIRLRPGIMPQRTEERAFICWERRMYCRMIPTLRPRSGSLPEG